MKIFKLPKLAELNPEAEHCLCASKNGTGNMRLTYGRLHKGATGKRLDFPASTEGYFYVIKGNVTVKTEKVSFLVGPGEAFYSKNGANYTLDNSCNSTVEYIQAIAGLPKDTVEKSPALETAKETEALVTEGSDEPEDDGLLITRDDPNHGEA